MNRFELLDFCIDTLDSQLPATLDPDKVELTPDERQAYRAILMNVGAENFAMLERFVRATLWGNNLAFILKLQAWLDSQGIDTAHPTIQ